MENIEIINGIKKKIDILKEMYEHTNTNKKAIVKELINAYELLKSYISNTPENKKIDATIDYYKYLDDNNENLRFNCPQYYDILSDELYGNKKINKNIFIPVTLIFNSNNKLNILTNSRNFLNLKEANEENTFDSLINIVGKDELLIRYTGELDNPLFQNFEEKASEKANSIIMIQTDRKAPIYYYGGKSNEEIPKVIDSINNYAKENGVSLKNSKKLVKSYIR